MDANDKWTLLNGEDDGKPIIFRIRNNPPSFARKDLFPHLLAICWKYESHNESGMPSQDVSECMAKLENLLIPAFEGREQAFLSAVVTGNGVREWQCYVQNPADAMQLVNRTLSHLEPFPLQFVRQDDSDWTGYARFLEILARATQEQQKRAEKSSNHSI